MSETPTPETDKKQNWNWDRPDNVEWKLVVPSRFASRLERERDQARRDLVGAEELHRRRFQTLKAEYDAMNVELKQAIDRICQIRLERDNALATLELMVKAWSKKEEAK
jgi:hypothetical protein